jgi:hypothetical protein
VLRFTDIQQLGLGASDLRIGVQGLHQGFQSPGIKDGVIV